MKLTTKAFGRSWIPTFPGVIVALVFMTTWTDQVKGKFNRNKHLASSKLTKSSVMTDIVAAGKEIKKSAQVTRNSFFKHQSPALSSFSKTNPSQSFSSSSKSRKKKPVIEADVIPNFKPKSYWNRINYDLNPDNTGITWRDQARKYKTFKEAKIDLSKVNQSGKNMVFQMDDKGDAIYGVVNMDHHLWARHTIRSARNHWNDYVVILGEIFDNVENIMSSIESSVKDRNVVFITFGGTTKLQSYYIESLSLYGLYLNENDRNSWHRKIAMIEQADLYISVDGYMCKEAGDMETPTLLVVNANYYNGCTKSETKYHSLGLYTSMADSASDILNQHRELVTFTSYLDPTMGYGSSAEHMVLGLDNVGLDTQFYGIRRSNSPQPIEDYCKPRTLELDAKRYPSDIFYGYYVPHEGDFWPLPRYAKKAKLLLLYTTFETSKPPSGWAPIVNTYDHLLVSCPQMEKSFEAIGVKTPISIVPLGVDPEIWPYQDRPSIESKKKFRFLLFADGDLGHHRKNYELAITAFIAAFDPKVDKVELVVKTNGGGNTPLMRILRSLLHRADIVLIERKFKQTELLDLLKGVDCLIFPSRGEGFGLPPREAMSTGVPVIAAGFAGMESIANSTFSYPLKWNWVKASGYDVWKPENLGSDDFGEWAEIDERDLIETLKHIVKNPDEVREKGRKARNFVINQETYRHCSLRGKKIMDPSNIYYCDPVTCTSV